MVKAVRYIREMGKGYCQPELFECNDGKLYVVKLMSNPQGIKGLPNELIAYRLGRLLDLPVMPGRVIYLSQDFIRRTSKLKKQDVQPGPHFGSLYLEKTKEPTSDAIASCTNHKQACGMIVFDHGIYNKDRALGNLLITDERNPKFYMIDYASCFSSIGWGTKHLIKHRKTIKPYWSDVYSRFVPFVDQKENPFREYCERVESVSKTEIARMMEEIPDKWGIRKEEFPLLIEFLNSRKSLMREAISQLRPHFPKWNSTA